ncbi:MAG: FtsW/RodA/SpoVE family cell cycle protein [Clostridiales bacterium]|nr:FtsW/RodA/SpoVE family cell cycle protein [Clostridiales bacterium]MDO4351366.1 FtsW/RodA/SpoVE family cell cycle protein [Eubacteriales bacterium]MDY4007830.1 FtsW/RodA/SpoVE family cell cycle protein [Candidatus Limiplasma sp.]
MSRRAQARAEARAHARSRRQKRRPDHMLVSAIMLFFFSAFLLIALNGELEWQGFALAVIVPVLIYISTMWLPRFFPADKLLLAIANFLCALGVLVLYSTDRGAGTSRGMQQAVYYGAGIIAMLACIFIVRYVRRWRFLIKVVMMGAAALLVLPLAIGTEQNGATNWITLGGTSVQPSEVVKLALLLALSWYMSRRRFWPWFLFAVFSLLVLMLQRDLGTALIYYATALFLFYASTGNLPLTGLGLLGGGGAAVAGYVMFAHVKKRVAIWRNPWIYYETSGYQIVQMLMAIASGGLFGVGLGLGAPRVIPVYFTDCIFAVICEQFGVIFGALVLAMYVILILRGASIASAARHSFHALLAMGATVMLGVQTFVIIGGVLKLIPLTGVTMPFVSYGGTSLVSCMGLIGLIQGVASVNQDDLAYDYEISHSLREAALLPEADGEE